MNKTVWFRRGIKWQQRLNKTNISRCICFQARAIACSSKTLDHLRKTAHIVWPLTLWPSPLTKTIYLDSDKTPRSRVPRDFSPLIFCPSRISVSFNWKRLWAFQFWSVLWLLCKIKILRKLMKMCGIFVSSCANQCSGICSIFYKQIQKQQGSDYFTMQQNLYQAKHWR